MTKEDKLTEELLKNGSERRTQAGAGTRRKPAHSDEEEQGQPQAPDAEAEQGKSRQSTAKPRQRRQGGVYFTYGSDGAPKTGGDKLTAALLQQSEWDMKRLMPVFRVKKKILVELNESETLRYFSALKIIYSQLDQQQALPAKIKVDKQGYSPDVADLLKSENYLSSYLIIAAPEQNDAPLIEPKFSFLGKFLDAVYSYMKDGIAMITKKEALLGEVQGNTALLDLTDLLALDSLDIKMDTPLELIRNKKTLNQLEKKLFEQDNILKDSFINSMLKIVSKLYSVYGDVRPYLAIPSWTELRYDVESFFCADSSFYKVKTKTPQGSAGKRVYFIDGKELSLNDVSKESRSNVIDKNVKNDLLTALLGNKLGYLSLNKLKEFVYHVEDDLLMSQGEDTTQLSPGARKETLKQTLAKISDKVRANYYFLKNLAQEAESYGTDITRLDSLADLTIDDKLRILETAVERPVLNHLLASVTSDIVLSYNSNPDVFKKTFSEANLLQSKNYLGRIIRAVSRGAENLELNQWLMDNYKDLCEEIGIRFAEVK